MLGPGVLLACAASTDLALSAASILLANALLTLSSCLPSLAVPVAVPLIASTILRLHGSECVKPGLASRNARTWVHCAHPSVVPYSSKTLRVIFNLLGMGTASS